MRAYLIRRLLQFVPTFLLVTGLTFLLLRLAPGDPMSASSDPALVYAVDGEAVRAWRELKGLDQPSFVQYGRWLAHLSTLDFGRSLIDERPVRELIAEALPKTLLLSGLALICIYGLSIPLGVYSAICRGQRRERWLSTGLFVLHSMPSFWIALLLILAFTGDGPLGLFPLRGLQSPEAASMGLGGRLLDTAWHLVLPVVCLAYPALASTSRYQRSAMLEVLQQDYIRTARAKGLTKRRAWLRHGLRNALLPIVALLSVDLPWLFGGSVIIERIFTIRGMGLLTFEAILRRDYPVIMGITAMIAGITLVVALVTDVVAALVDPRIRLSRRGG